jgi:hypothetical protein
MDPTTMAIALAAAVQTCDWTQRGRDPYRGTMTAAVERYPDIPAPTRRALAARMERQQFDEVVAIRRHGVDGYAGMRDMHWGAGRVCRGPVDKTGWTASDEEIGLVYCEAGHCLIVPTVCRNVSRIERLPQARTALLEVPGGTGGAAVQAGDVLPAALVDIPQILLAGPLSALAMPQGAAGELVADAPGAGPSGGQAGAGSVMQAGAVFSAVSWLPALVPGPAVGDAPDPGLVAAIPEASTRAMLALGLALVALAARIGRRE